MNKFGRFVWVLLSISFGQQAFALDCVALPEQPFETATTVFLAQVTENSLETADSKAAPIMILKVYKGDVVQIKKITRASNSVM